MANKRNAVDERSAKEIKRIILSESIPQHYAYHVTPVYGGNELTGWNTQDLKLRYEPDINIFAERLRVARSSHSLESEIAEIEAFERNQLGYVSQQVNFGKLLAYCYALDAISEIQDLEEFKTNHNFRKRLETTILKRSATPQELSKILKGYGEYGLYLIELAGLLIGETGIFRTVGDYTVKDLLKIKKMDERHFGRDLNTIMDEEVRKPLYLCYRNKIEFDEAEELFSLRLISYLNQMHGYRKFVYGEIFVPEKCQDLPSAHVLSHFFSDFFHHNGMYGLKCLQYLTGLKPGRTIKKAEKLLAKIDLDLALATVYSPSTGAGWFENPLSTMTKPERISWIRDKAQQTGLDYTHLIEEISSLGEKITSTSRDLQIHED